MKKIAKRLTSLLFSMLMLLSLLPMQVSAEEALPEELSESEPVTYSYKYKTYTWDEAKNMYRTASNGSGTSATPEVTIPVPAAGGVTIDGVDYAFAGWRIGKVGNYVDVQTEKQFGAGEPVVADISELPANRYLEVFAVYAEVPEEPEPVTYSYMYKVYTWVESSNMYRPAATGKGTSATPEATIPVPETGNVTIGGVDYAFAGWRIGKVGNYVDVQTEKQFGAGEPVVADISELPANRYLEVFAVYTEIPEEPEPVTYSYMYKVYTWVESSNMYRPAATGKGTSATPEVTIPVPEAGDVTIGGVDYAFAGWRVGKVGNYVDVQTEKQFDAGEPVVADISELPANRYLEVFAVYAEVEKEPAYDGAKEIGSGENTWTEYICFHANYPEGTDETFVVKYTLHAGSSGNTNFVYSAAVGVSYADCGFTVPEGYALQEKYWAASADAAAGYRNEKGPGFNFSPKNDGQTTNLYAIYDKTAEPEPTSYSYMYKVYTWDEARNSYGVAAYRHGMTSATPEVTIPVPETGNVTIDGVDYTLAGWRVGKVGNYVDVQTEKQFAVGEPVVADISELPANHYLEIFAVYAAAEDPAVQTTYTVIYTDGVDGEELFADQITTELLSGAKTPAFNGTPSRKGYVFNGWSPEVAETVTADATYTATWKPAGSTTDNSDTGNNTSIPKTGDSMLLWPWLITMTGSLLALAGLVYGKSRKYYGK